MLKGDNAMKKIVLLAAAAAVVAAAGALSLGHAPVARAADPAPEPRLAQCVDTHSLRTKMIVSKNQLVLEDDFHHAALVTLAEPCGQMDELDHIGFEIQGDSRICGIHDMKILYSHGMGDDHMPPLRCLMTDLKPLTLDQVKAYSSSSSSSSH